FMFVMGADNQMDIITPEVQTIFDVVSRIAEQNPAFMIHGGDLVVDGRKTNEWFTFLETFEELSPHVPIMPVFGNHEYDGPIYKKLFAVPSNNDPDPDNEGHWYSFRYNNSWFIGLDVYFSDYSEGSAQYNWLVEELNGIDRNEIDHVFVWLHYGGYASLGYHGPNMLVRQRLEPLFDEYNVTATFGGHNHFYERSIVNGRPSFISGGLGIHLKDFTPNSNPWSAYVEKSNHFLKVYVNGKHVRVEMMRIDGTIADVYENFQVDGRDIDWIIHMVEPVIDEEGLMTEPNLKLERLFVTHDDAYYYFGFDAPATDKGVSYGLYIDTDNEKGSGGTTDRWGKAVAAEVQHLPEVQIYAYHNSNGTWSSNSPSYYHWDVDNEQWITGTGGMARLPEGGIFAIDNENRFFEIAIPRDAPGFDGVEHFHVKLFTVGSASGAGVSAVLPNDALIRFTEENTSTETTLLTQFYWYNAPDTTTVVEYPIIVDGDPADWFELDVAPVAVATNTTQLHTQYMIDSLFVHMDEHNLYLGLRTNAVDERMHFGIYIDTDNVPNSGGATNPWGASLTTVAEHRPEIAIFGYHNELGGWSGSSPQYYVWTGSSWVRQLGGHGNMPPGGEFAHQQSHGFFEMLIPRDSPGLEGVERLHIAAYNFGMSKFVAEVLPSDTLVQYTGQNLSVPVEMRYFALYELDKDPTSIKREHPELPDQVILHQNYPNPFNPTTIISFSLPQASVVRLEVFNLMGQKVATLVNEPRSVGHHQIQFDASGLASGVYLYRLQTGTMTKTQKMLLLK
ncbi:MAG: metallophosphoesterase, partial [Cyclonatronaceae bacterium]